MENSALEELVYELVERVNKLEQHNNEHHARERVSGKAYQAKAMVGWDVSNKYEIELKDDHILADTGYRLRRSPEYLRQAAGYTAPVGQPQTGRMI